MSGFPDTVLSCRRIGVQSRRHSPSDEVRFPDNEDQPDTTQGEIITRRVMSTLF